MSRCRACDRIMKKCDYEIVDEEGKEEDLCKSCRQEIFKHSDEAINLGFSVDEAMEMEEGFYVDYRGGRFDE